MESWNVEHVRLRHFYLDEPLDPNFFNCDVEFARAIESLNLLKRTTTATSMPIWKWFYSTHIVFKDMQIKIDRKHTTLII